MMSEKTPLCHVGLVIIGDEILNSRYPDRHLVHVNQTWGPRGIQVVRVWLVGDHEDRLSRCLVESRGSGHPVFCFGGIGATPDDHTRQAAATAWGVPLVRHPEAVSLLENRFGTEAYPHRIRMAELPAGCGLVPNPIHTMPGFCLDHHYFLPGFPEMAWPMMQQVIHDRYLLPGHGRHTRWLLLPDGQEGRVVSLLASLEKDYPGIQTFSLPRLQPSPLLELGVKGDNALLVEAAFGQLASRLATMGLQASVLGEG